ncbi:MAG: hypothetical protein IIY02_05505 [Firmicutes bacterium]|nr:hypothetical protein [Bacillota bacterium]
MINRKLIVALLSLVLVVALSIGGTFAWLNDTSDTVTNTFKPGEIVTRVDETFDGNVKSNVSIENVKTDNAVDAYIRAEIVVTWQKDNGNVYGQLPVEGVDYTIGLDVANGWVLAEDGFYYWTKPVAPGAKTGILITTCAPVDGKAPKGYSLCVEVISTAIQTVPTSVVTTEWSTGVSAVVDGELTIKR